LHHDFSFQCLRFSFFCFQYGIQGVKALIPELCYVPGPCFQFEHGVWVDLVDVLLRSFFHLHQLRLTEHFEML